MSGRSWVFSSVLFAGACSLINSFDDVAPEKDGTGTGGDGASSGSGGDSGGTSGSSGTNAGGKGGGSSGSSTAGTSGDAGAGGEGGGGLPPLPPTGRIVIGGSTLDADEGLLSVLDAETGAELRRELLPSGVQIAGIAHDGAEDRDVWFIFESDSFPPEADTPVDLQVRRFDDRTNQWTTISTATALPAPQPDSFAVLNGRLAYISYDVSGSTVTTALTILDTEDLDDVHPVNFTQPTLTGSLLGLIGLRGTLANPTGLGGALDLAVAQNCGAGVSNCDLFIQPLAVGNSINATLGDIIDPFRGTPAFATGPSKGLIYAALPPIMGSVKLYQSGPLNPENATSLTAPPTVSDLGGLAIAECQGVGVFTSGSGHSAYGVTLSVGVGRTLDLGRPGQLVEWEPFTGAVIAPYNPSDAELTLGAMPTIDAIEIISDGATSLSPLTRRPASSWNAPTDIRTNTMAVRLPFPFECP